MFSSQIGSFGNLFFINDGLTLADHPNPGATMRLFNCKIEIQNQARNFILGPCVIYIG